MLFLLAAMAGLMVVIDRQYVFFDVGTVLKCYLDCLETSKDSVSLTKNISQFCYQFVSLLSVLRIMREIPKFVQFFRDEHLPRYSCRLCIDDAHHQSSLLHNHRVTNHDIIRSLASKTARSQDLLHRQSHYVKPI